MENNGRGIFYGVIGVATLVVAIIGATFAYFSAQAGGTKDLTTGAAKITLEAAEVTDYLQGKLVPVETGYKDPADATISFAGQTSYLGQAYPTEEAKINELKAAFSGYANLNPNGYVADANSDGVNDGTWCKDKNGNAICSVYSVTLSNDSDAGIELDGEFKTTTNGMQHLKFAIFRGTPKEIFTNGGWTVNGEDKVPSYKTGEDIGALIVPTTAVAASGNVNNTTIGGKDRLDFILEAQTDATFTVMLWIEETGDEQSDDGSFAGSLSFKTPDGQGITGVLGA